MLAMLNSLPEPGRLALLGLGLIMGALFLRKLLLPAHAALEASPKADATAK